MRDLGVDLAAFEAAIARVGNAAAAVPKALASSRKAKSPGVGR